jgi:chorismate mutase/prephenate dehydrogenase
MGQIKASHMLPLRVLEVEKVVIGRYASKAEETHVSEEALCEIAKILIKESVEIQARIPRPSASKNILVIGGAGNMGRWMCDYFSSRNHNVQIFDIKQDEKYQNAVNLGEGSRTADVIVISSPIETIADTLQEIISFDTKALIFDIASIKSPFLEISQSMAEMGVHICSVHPMFGSRANGIIDRNVIVCDCGDVSAVDAAETLFEGANITKIDVAEHDKLMAYVLGLSHALNIVFNATLMKSGISFDLLSSVSSTTFQKQTELSIDVAYDNAELYYMIQKKNPYNAHAFVHLKDSISDLRASDRGTFLEHMVGARKYFSQSQ